MSSFGHFSEDGREFCISEKETPRPLLNYIWNSSILSGVNQFGGGEGSYGGRTSSYIDPNGKGRCSLFRNGNRYFYLKNEDTGEVWNPGWFPTQSQLDSFECVHGLGYSVIKSSFKGIEVTARVFVNEEDPVEIWSLNLKNTTEREQNLKVFSFVEYSLEGYSRYSDYNSYVHGEFDEENNLVVCFNKAQERPHDWFNGFMATNLKVTGFDTSRKDFIGAYGSTVMPEVVKNGKCTNSLAACELMVGVLENSFSLKPSQEIDFHVLMGATDTRKRATELVQKLFKENKIDEDFAKVKNCKNKVINDINVKTPDKKVNVFANCWLKQQVQLCAEVGRDTGKGFRDQLQDAWAVASFNPELAKEKIIETLMHEYSDGRCVRGWLPLDQHVYSDGPTWIAPAINAYLKETGDFEFLNVIVPYLDKGEASVLEHILTAVRHSSEDIGERELVLARDGDWNDSLNMIGLQGKGESVWTSISLYYALNNTAEIARVVLNNIELEKEMLERAEKIKKAINDNGWDGEWYLAAYNDKGEKVGTHTEKEGSTYLNSQTWAVMAGVAEGDRVEKCLKAVDTKLDSAYGPLTLYPTYTKFNSSIGRLTSFIPGIWENGTPYCHGGTFKIVADCMVGRGNEAYKTMLKILPDSIENPSTKSGCEPYALTNMYFGPDNPRAGQTMFAWVTGTAGWMFRAMTQYMLGFYPEYDGFCVKPCIPEEWKECSITRVFRGDTYKMEIKNNNPSGKLNIVVDGKSIDGDYVKIFGDKKEHVIEVSFV